MGTILLLLLFPIGLITYFWDKKNYQQTLETFENYIVKIKHADLQDEDKIEKIDHMFYNNNYKITSKDTSTLRVEKKHFNIGILLMVFGLFNYFGIVGYIVYYKFFLKPRRLNIDLNKEDVFIK